MRAVNFNSLEHRLHLKIIVHVNEPLYLLEHFNSQFVEYLFNIP